MNSTASSFPGKGTGKLMSGKMLITIQRRAQMLEKLEQRFWKETASVSHLFSTDYTFFLGKYPR
jgi:hypothetical protein